MKTLLALYRSHNQPHTILLYKDFGEQGGVNVCRLVGSMYICYDPFVREITQERGRNQCSTVGSANEFVPVSNIVVKILSCHACPNDNKPQIHSNHGAALNQTVDMDILCNNPEICSNKLCFLFLPTVPNCLLLQAELKDADVCNCYDGFMVSI